MMSSNRSFVCFNCFQFNDIYSVNIHGCNCSLDESQRYNIRNTLTSITQQQKYSIGENEKRYLNLFQPRISEDNEYLYFPSVAILCLHFEFMVTDPFILCKLAKAVQKYIAVALGDLHNTASTELRHHDSSSTRMAVYEALSSFYLDVPPEFSSAVQSAYSLLKEEIRILCGDELFHNELLKLLNLQYSVASGLVPAYSRFMNIRCKSNSVPFTMFMYIINLPTFFHIDDIFVNLVNDVALVVLRSRTKTKSKEASMGYRG